MSTIIYPSPIFGPVTSRRLGISLGINLMPGNGKVCTFDCIYCECGYNGEHFTHKKRPTREQVRTALRSQLEDMSKKKEPLDVLTFAGNGEPTAHPDFLGIVEDVIVLRNQYYPQAKVSVLSNGSLIHRPGVFQALMLVDKNILKLDTVNLKYIQAVNRPILHYTPEEQVKNMLLFHGHIIIQTMFMKSVINGVEVDNTDNSYVNPWLKAIKRISPQEVMIYTIDRETPDKTLTKTDKAKLDAIVSRVEALGIPATAAY
ncbi:MAG: radical SAM protein [Bacteroidaceae bacterium]|jgi:wyosine [tRNA(Phe)-imidazoG37] synthetase (radical SAM superfamily)|nr:radical SAM protein [Bacteroidaceae bacterium]